MTETFKYKISNSKDGECYIEFGYPDAIANMPEYLGMDPRVEMKNILHHEAIGFLCKKTNLVPLDRDILEMIQKFCKTGESPYSDVDPDEFGKNLAKTLQGMLDIFREEKKEEDNGNDKNNTNDGNF